MIEGSDVYKVVAWPDQALNPNAGKSFKGVERSHCDGVLELAIERGAPIARKKRKGAADEYVVHPSEYDEVKAVLAAIVREGLKPADLVHARPLIQEVLNEAGAG